MHLVNGTNAQTVSCAQTKMFACMVEYNCHNMIFLIYEYTFKINNEI